MSAKNIDEMIKSIKEPLKQFSKDIRYKYKKKKLAELVRQFFMDLRN